MQDAGAGRHALNLTRFNPGPIAQTVAVLELPRQDVGEDLHIAMRVRREAVTWQHPVFVDDPERSESHERRIVMFPE